MQVKNLHRCFVLCFVWIALSVTASAQFYADNKEKIYVQTNHVFFKQGETLFFKLYVVKAQDQTPTRISNVVYTELISPAGTVVQKASYAIQDGYAQGSFDFNAQQPGGIYKLRTYTSWMRNENESNFFLKEVTLQKVLAPRILMKLDFPEKGYGAGDEVYANFSMRNLNDEPIKNYTGKFVVSVGGEQISTETFKTDFSGKARIQFKLPATLTVNDGLLNVQVVYDSYTESISRSIPIVLNKIDLQFMPEGGTLVNGISSVIAFKALNENGKAADIKGVIKDASGNTVTQFESYHFGMGKFLLTPQNGVCYKAYITSPSNISQVYDLPLAVTDGVVMQLSKEKKKITLALHTSFARDVKLKVSSRNTTYHLQHVSLRQGVNIVTLDENIFPAGISQFSLFTENELPLAERLAFLNEDQQLHVKITPGKKQYGPREKVNLTIKTTDENGKPVSSNFSLAVVDDKLWTFADDKQDHILSWLLLSSELKGKIEEPQFYFKKEEAKAIPALDLLMLTQGYRYFDYTEYVVKNNSLQYLPDQDNILSGQILDTARNPIAAKVFLVNTVPGGKGMEITTGADGQFFFSHLVSGTGYYLFAQAIDKKEKINIQVTQNGLGYNPAKARALKQLFAAPAETKFTTAIAAIPGVRKRDEAKMPAALLPQLNENKNATLNEVVVTALGQSKQARQLGYAITRVQANDIVAGTKLQNALTGKVAGLNIATVNNGVFADTRVMLRGIRSITGGNQPLYVLNGMPMEKLNLDQLNPNDINYISVLKEGTATSMFGSAASNGAIIIETKKYFRERLAFRINDKFQYASQVVYTQGSNFTPVKNFYAPAYQTPYTEERTDFRETIYWNPVVQTDKEGKASVEFYNSDASTTFRALAEGIGYNGKLGRGEATYSVSSILQADAKIPPYLTVGDKALIPLVIKNNGDDEEEITIRVKAPEGFKTGEFTDTITVAAGASEQVLIPTEATTAASGTIDFTISSSSTRETLHLPIQAADKGFPVKLNFSGNTTASHQFAIRDMIPGTLQAKLKLFNNVEGQLLDGIESMLREPYGCFEQTSSSTYPNILILKYLKESGKSKPEIEKKALDLIQRGYDRLIGFETPINGFEWFGKTPPHEALTAYGLLEFTDMQEFIDVDKKMLERTKKFLLKRRDGKGTFDMVNRGYDQFASVPNKIANIYIVYALTRAGIGKEIQKEYETAVKQALSSNDGYQLSMMANAAYLMKDMGSYNKLLEAVAGLESKEILNAETSVVNSRSASLRVETYALYAMALMKAQNPEMVKIASLLSKILAEKSYYGYGSTQSTVMALQAIVEFSRLMPRTSGDAPVTFTLNNKTVTDYTKMNEMTAGGSNSFTVFYPDQAKAVPYGFEISYSTYTPPNSELAELQLNTSLKATTAQTGETVRMDITVSNTKAVLQPMAIAKIGIPAGLSAQPWQLKEIMEKNKAAYYEIFDNYVVFYWMGFAPNETKTISLDLKAEVPGSYRAKASNVYLYYTPEYKHWNEGTIIEVKD
jgi:TonB-dependent SusC/RagA subfamily outer membrane receptor